MDNLFSIFDPSTSNYFSLNWLSMFSVLLVIPYQFWNSPNRLMSIYNLFSKYMSNDLKVNLNQHLYSNLSIFTSLFIFIIFMNFMGLFPYIFTPTSHLIISIGLCFPLWLSFMMKNIFINTFNTFSHLVPSGTPFILAPFMVLIETTSIMIRPITLSVRLSANMIAGHLLIVLLSNLMKKSIILYSLSLIPIFILLLLEISVAFIQGYVFVVLLSLYLNESDF